ncbi:hypothetical protein [Ruminiclostridium papyrosolvens]|uniref:Uncharacterized protein n=1 Tax=Ruminiclostridium papyrosolvens C7 TaxID=1330534 RepID=U4R2A4_9FIRM|nr:hypothetical protein [Ruminiclostridium papyrosolvens]EPR12469.1 hypothetical protein L323_08000 [Ruminiclostridium papyrosolvens C7]
MKIVEDMEKWDILKAAMLEKGYVPYSWQYSLNQEEGLHIWFYKRNSDLLKRVEIVTHKQAIADDIKKCDW